MKTNRAYKEIAYSHIAPGTKRFNKVVVDSSPVDLFISETILNALACCPREVQKQMQQSEVDQFSSKCYPSERCSWTDLSWILQQDGFIFFEEFNKLSDFIRNNAKSYFATTNLDQKQTSGVDESKRSSPPG